MKNNLKKRMITMNRHMFSILVILTVLCTSCSKEPSELIIGHWELEAIQRKDTLFFHSRYQSGYLAIEINYNNDPLIISYDTLGNFRSHTDLPFTYISSHTEQVYNLIFSMDISSDGTFIITEEYQDLNSITLLSWQYSSTWNRVEQGIENYEFYFQLDDPFTNLHPSKIFPLDNILFLQDEDITRNKFTIYKSDYDDCPNSLFIYSFEKK
jgi:hypothetical protein